jgi:hypothetical protein
MNEEPGCAAIGTEAIGHTEYYVGSFTQQRVEFLVVTIQRPDGDQTRTWSLTLDAGPRGKWEATYGFVFAPDDDEKYFSAATDDGKFKVTNEQDRGGLAFVPAVFYTWFPASRDNRSLSFGLSAGLGFDTSNPVVLLGGSATFNRNVSLVAGAMVRKVTRLNGQYDPDHLPIVSENLTADQLQTSVFRPTYFVSLSFRFDSAPFASSKDPKPEPTKPSSGGHPDKPKEIK